jgi:6-phosphogluconolactonase/glucosamine-6-phosphate isomerase/deaminase
VLLLVAGADKADMLHEIFVTQQGKGVYPVQRVAPVDGIKAWLLDEAAAAKLPA